MPDVHVTRHGQRWAVADDPLATPISEHATREEAESAARRLADGGEVHVFDEDPSGLAGHEDTGGAGGAAGGQADRAAATGSADLPAEELRGQQASF